MRGDDDRAQAGAAGLGGRRGIDVDGAKFAGETLEVVGELAAFDVVVTDEQRFRPPALEGRQARGGEVPC